MFQKIHKKVINFIFKKELNLINKIGNQEFYEENTIMYDEYQEETDFYSLYMNKCIKREMEDRVN